MLIAVVLAVYMEVRAWDAFRLERLDDIDEMNGAAAARTRGVQQMVAAPIRLNALQLRT